MAGMTGIITNSSQINAVYLAVAGTLIFLPLIVAMVLIFQKYGLMASLAFSAFTDPEAAYFMKEISLKAGFETFIIFFFVVAGLKVA